MSDRQRTEVSNPDRVIFPDNGVTKGDVVAHYERVGESMIRFVADRALTLQRFPRGIEAKGFMQKNASDHFPDSIRRHEVPKVDGGSTVYAVVDRAADLAYLANQGTVTFHVGTSTVSRPDHPDWLILDLDPSAGDLDGVRVATRTAAIVLERFGLTGFPLATGSTGFHVWVPLDGAGTVDEAVEASRALAGLVALTEPERTTTEFLKKDRAGRVFVDWLRNGAGATTVVPFSIRPRPGAPVAVPIEWDELDHVRPDQWTLRDLGDRLSVATDLPTQRLPFDEIVTAARTAGVDLDVTVDRFGRRSRRD